VHRIPFRSQGCDRNSELGREPEVLSNAGVFLWSRFDLLKQGRGKEGFKVGIWMLDVLRRTMASLLTRNSGTKDIVVYTAATMNGWKPIVFLEEAGVDYDLVFVDFAKKEQKDPEYMKLNPNGRVPTIVDRSNGNFPVFESAAILWYLAEKYDRFLPKDPKEKSETLQWLSFQIAHVGPTMGQAMYFQRIAAQQGNEDPFAIKRFVDESRRILEVLNGRLKNRSFLVGEQYTIADMATYTWARCHYWANVPIDELPHLQAWFDRIDAREATQRALTIPKAVPAFFGRGNIEETLKSNADRFNQER